jgi:hypothetical protein
MASSVKKVLPFHDMAKEAIPKLRLRLPSRAVSLCLHGHFVTGISELALLK